MCRLYLANWTELQKIRVVSLAAEQSRKRILIARDRDGLCNWQNGGYWSPGADYLSGTRSVSARIRAFRNARRSSVVRTRSNKTAISRPYRTYDAKTSCTS